MFFQNWRFGGAKSQPTPLGTVKWIGVRPTKPEGKKSFPINSKESVQCLPETGLEGDYYSQKPAKNRQVTLISCLDLDRLRDRLNLSEPIRPDQTRRNLLIEWNDQDEMWSKLSKGDQLCFGDCGVELEVTGNCDPCFKMNTIHPKMEETMKSLEAFGLCCQIIKGGTISVGDAIRKK